MLPGWKTKPGESIKSKNCSILFVCTNKIYIFVPDMENEDSKYCGCLYYSANALGRVMTRMAEEEFSVTGLAPSYAFLLMGVNEKPGIQPGEISIQMQLTPSTVTRLIEKMEQKGYVERKSAGRATQVYPTDKSRVLDDKIKEAWVNLFNRYSKILGEENARDLTANIYEAYKTINV